MTSEENKQKFFQLLEDTKDLEPVGLLTGSPEKLARLSFAVDVKNVLGSLELHKERMNDIWIYFYPNQECKLEFRHKGKLIIDLLTRECKVRDIDTVYTTTCTPLEVMDIYTRMAQLIRTLNLIVTY